MATEDRICPECQQGKHQNCDGLAWDFIDDKLTNCDCDETAHPLRIDEGETDGDDCDEEVSDADRIAKWGGPVEG